MNYMIDAEKDVNLGFEFSRICPQDAWQAAVPVLVISRWQVQSGCQIQAILTLVPAQQSHPASACRLSRGHLLLADQRVRQHMAAAYFVIP